ncbi:MAG TPA: chalcone isomerase family protein [bacterium]
MGTRVVRQFALAAAVAAAAAMFASDTLAAVVKGVTFPDSVAIGGRECRLNGVGVRTKFIVSVYLGALYVATPTADGVAAIAADEPKRTVLHFVHSKVEAEKIREAWREGFAANAGAALPQLKERLERFAGWFDEDLHKDERIELTYVPGKGTEVAVKGKVRGTIEGADFMRALWSVWLGEKPVDGGLKEGMLAGAQR